MRQATTDAVLAWRAAAAALAGAFLLLAAPLFAATSLLDAHQAVGVVLVLACVALLTLAAMWSPATLRAQLLGVRARSRDRVAGSLSPVTDVPHTPLLPRAPGRF